MPKIRPTTTTALHATLATAALDWDTLVDDTLQRYSFRHGIAHLLWVQRISDAQQLLPEFRYALQRIAQLGAPGLRGFITDFQACSARKGDELSRWAGFLQGNDHLIALADESWSAERIFFQRAIEHGDDSPLTIKAEQWLQDSPPPWIWMRRKRRPRSVDSPLLQTLTAHDDELESLDLWQGLLVSRCSGYRMVVWSADFDAELLQVDADGLSTKGDSLLYWFEEQLFVWSPDLDEPLQLIRFDEEWVIDAQWLSPTQVLFITNNGGVYTICTEDSQPQVILHTGEGCIRELQLLDNGRLLCHQLRWSSRFGADAESSGEPNSESLELVEASSEELSVEESSEEAESESERPVDPRLLLLDVTQPGAEPTVLHSAESGLAEVLCCGSLAVLMERDGSISAIDTTTGQVQQHWPLLFGAEALSESKELHHLSDTHVVAWSNRQEGRMLLLDLSSGAVHALEGHSDMIDSVVVINGQLMSCCFDGTIRCWSLDDGRCQTTLRKPSPHGVRRAIQLSAQRMVAWSFDSHLSIWDLENESIIGRLFGHTGSVASAVVLPGGRLASTSMFDSKICVWDPSLAQLTPPIDNHSDVLLNELLVHENQLVTGAHDTTLRVWSLDSGECLQILAEHEQPLQCLVQSGEEVFSSGWDPMEEDGSTVLRWNISGALLRRYPHPATVGGIHPFEHRLLTWAGPSLYLWERESGQQHAELEGHSASIWGGMLLDQQWLSWSRDGSLRLWNLETLKCTQVLQGHPGGVRNVLRVNELLLSASREDEEHPASIKLWEQRDAEWCCAHTLTGFKEPPDAALLVDQQLWTLSSHGAHCWSLDSPDTPLRLRKKALRQQHPAIWKQLRQKAVPEIFLPHGEIDNPESSLVLTHSNGEQSRWHADGDWVPRRLLESGQLLATCWTDLAIVEVYRGTQKLSKSNVQAWLNSSAEDH